MKIALASLNQLWENKVGNRSLCEGFASLASTSGIDMLVFPEMTLTGFSMNPENTAEAIDSSPTIDFFKTLSIKNNLAIVFGVCLHEAFGFTNCAIFVSNSGTVEAIYRKIHPFAFAGEDKHFLPGNEITVFHFEGCYIGLSICYDLRFPELYRLYADNCQMVINIANWPEKRIDHWTTLLKARAIENQYVVIGVNRTGRDKNQLSYIESSNIFLPDGLNPKLVHRENVYSAYEINPWCVGEYRKSFPVLQDRRKGWYEKNGLVASR